jgi:hypothetical protein
MINVNKFSVFFFIIAVIAMYLQNIYIEALALFLTYIFHYPNSYIFVDENHDDYTNSQT